MKINSPVLKVAAMIAPSTETSIRGDWVESDFREEFHESAERLLEISVIPMTVEINTAQICEPFHFVLYCLLFCG